MRVFIAIPTPDRVAETIILDTAALRGAYPDLKWIGMDALHLTLNFLGEVIKEQLEPICQVMDAAGQAQAPFRLRYHGLGFFPPRGRPRVLYLHVEEGRRECELIQRVLSAGLDGIVRLDRRKFTPHLTLARIKNSRKWPDVYSEGTDKSAEFTAERIVLFRSHLKPDGAEYEELYSVQLGRDKEDV